MTDRTKTGEPTPPSDLIGIEKIARAIARRFNKHREPSDDEISAAQAARERIGWQPIETAPKDQWILVFIEAEDEHAGRVHAARNRKIANGFSWVVGHHFASDLAGKPTHWMPQPDPPSNKGLIHDDG